MQECNCGCGLGATTSTGWAKGHWNRGKRHIKRRKKGTRQKALQEEREIRAAQKKKAREIKKLEDLNPCKCGCGAQVKGTWKWGHHSRVNNISKRDDIRKRRSEAMKKRHRVGIMPEVWNKGETKESDSRVANYGKSVSTAFTDERKENQSKMMADLWKSGSIIPLTGSDHSQWQGGTSAITQRIRGAGMLYKLWRYPILKRDNFTCQRCKQTGDLVVHHYDERMADIVKRFIPEDKHELSWDEQTEVVENVITYHVQNDIKGIALCNECHEVVHLEESSPNGLCRKLELHEILAG